MEALRERGVVDRAAPGYADAYAAAVEEAALAWDVQMEPRTRLGEWKPLPHHLPRMTRPDVVAERLADAYRLHEAAVERLGGTHGELPPGVTMQQYSDALDWARERVSR